MAGKPILVLIANVFVEIEYCSMIVNRRLSTQSDYGTARRFTPGETDRPLFGTLSDFERFMDWWTLSRSATRPIGDAFRDDKQLFG